MREIPRFNPATPLGKYIVLAIELVAYWVKILPTKVFRIDLWKKITTKVGRYLLAQ